ncbi:DUF2336 domain-containing protein [Pannonibacter tanglangensis]|uniref:DUF2336 domain-containing protein n=1 Tax=Pannonibacter tanglangensis TaxID=2750084 RepID=A0ABW9ZFM6_9HYPH|nr:DUF2336 domain-containing protein [Pannonibacter sp. XCT-34]NBN63653.1 DUF2336 domain-containing protein [Pannonibacter sp. XCT-34]
MIIRQFLQWIDTAPPAARAEATGALARAFLHSPLSAEDRAAAEAALTWLLDDPAPEVRFAMADVFARRADAPRHLVLSLMHDRSEIAALVAGHSPLVPDSDLIDLAAAGDLAVQRAIAARSDLSAPVAAALAEVAPACVCAVLLDNETARLLAFSLSRLAERFATETDLRNRLLARPHLPLPVRHRLLTALTEGLRARAVVLVGSDPDETATYLEEAQERATLVLCSQAGEDALPAFVEHLRASGQLTARLLIRATGTGDLPLLTTSLALLTGQDRRKVALLLESGREAALRALMTSAGLPARTHAVLVPALIAYRTLEADPREMAAPLLVRQVMDQVARTLESDPEAATAAGADLVQLVRLLALEAARSQARHFVESSRKAA